MQIGILTSGGDCPGLNAAIRGVARAGQEYYNMQVIGFRDGFRGLIQDRFIELENRLLSGILTDGGTILGTSRDKPHKMPIGGKVQNMIDVAVENYRRHRLDALVCIGGGGTHKNALRLKEAGLNIMTIPKTIDNDVFGTDTSFGFDTALDIATDAIDRLHSTAMSHGRIIVVEIMGHRAGWLALGAGLAGGADVILIPEIPYQEKKVANAILKRYREGKNFSIVAVAEGAMSVEQARKVKQLVAAKDKARSRDDKKNASEKLIKFHAGHVSHTVTLTRSLEKITGLESRLTILGHVQRGGTPSAADRILATRLGTACAEAIHDREFGVMIAARGQGTERIKLEKVCGKKNLVPPDHEWVETARLLGVCLGD